MAVRRITLVTEGDAGRISGGYLYQRRVLEPRRLAHGIETRVVAVPARRFPLALVDGPRVLRAAARDADVVVVDSLASNTLGPWIALGLLRRPMVGSVHQRLGGTDLSGADRRSAVVRPPGVPTLPPRAGAQRTAGRAARP